MGGKESVDQHREEESARFAESQSQHGLVTGGEQGRGANDQLRPLMPATETTLYKFLPPGSEAEPTEWRSTQERVKSLRNQGFTNREIAEELDISQNTVAAYASRYIKSGEVTPTKSAQKTDRKERIKQLRDKGLKNAEIAAELGISNGTVEQYASELVQRGEVFPRRAGKKKEKVRQLRNEGRSNAEIARLLGISAGTVSSYASDLIGQGEITPQKQRINKDDVIQMRNQGLKNAEIAEALGISPAVLGNYVSRLIKSGEVSPRKSTKNQQQ